jgi:hypothetical protein
MSKKASILVIQGPNLNLLGTREPEVYGTTTLNDIHQKLEDLAQAQSVDLSTYQSNHEGELIDRIQKAKQDALGKLSDTIKKVSYSSQRQYAVSSHVNYIEPKASSMYTDIKKSVAIGKSVYKVGLPLNAPISTKNYYPSGTRSALQRARSGGCSAPKKKGSIYNTSLTQSGINGYGSLPRQGY